MLLVRDANMNIQKTPLISIITVCYNVETEIEQTICSVLKQTDTDYEYIIVDGKSKDCTMQIIERYTPIFIENNITLQVISEPDNGIFDAMNKGIRNAHGMWINFMNAGDSFHDNEVLNNIKKYLKNSKADVVYGNCYRYNEFYSYLKIPGDIKQLEKGMEISHQASFIRKKIQKKFPFSLKYQIASDHDLFLRLYLQGYQFEYVPQLICDFSLGGVSSSRLLTAYKETYMIRVNNGIVNPNRLISKVMYGYGYFLRMLELILPANLKWKLKAVKKRIIENKNAFISKN